MNLNEEMREAIELVNLAKLMEKMANEPREAYDGVRQPGERGAYERHSIERSNQCAIRNLEGDQRNS